MLSVAGGTRSLSNEPAPAVASRALAPGPSLKAPAAKASSPASALLAWSQLLHVLAVGD